MNPLLLSLLMLSALKTQAAPSATPLQGGWSLQSSCQLNDAGEKISLPGYQPRGWHPASVPSTVLAALVADKTYPDPFIGMNLRNIPGTDYPLGENFSKFPMSSTSPFHCSWWYRKDFKLPAAAEQDRLWLRLDGVNYRANLWLNGRKLADGADLAGAWRTYELDVTTSVRPGSNALAIEVFAPKETDLAITWVDWNPAPPDKNMGLFRPVKILRSGPVALRDAQVKAEPDPDLKAASVAVSADLRNATDRKVRGVLEASWAGRVLRQDVELAPRQSRRVALAPQRMQSPRIWWPYQMGEPALYTLRLDFKVAGAVSDAQTIRFGVRKITSEFTANGARLFKVNGRPVLIRGGGWSPDMLWRFSPKRLAQELAYVRHMGLNTIRLEGKLERDEFFDLADRLGILVMAGWCCCDMWEHWDKWQDEQHRISAQSLHDQIVRLRNHPSLLVWLNGSDGPPPADVEQAYLDVLKAQEWPNPVVSSASGSSTTVTGNSGVKMSGPYDYVPPAYWLSDQERGGAFGFNTETSPGPAIPTQESLCRILPEDHRWPIDSVWNYHAGGTQFSNMDIFGNALEKRYGKASTLSDFVRKSQAMAYEGERAMFEAYGRNKFVATGVIQWMLNNAWPSTIWHLYDHFLVPGGGYFGTRKACEQVHVQYSYDDRSVVVVNGGARPLNGLRVQAKVFGLDGKERSAQDARVDLAADSSQKALVLPELSGLTTAYFLRLALADGSGKALSENFYWLSTKADAFDWGKSTWYHTPQTAYADYSALSELPQVQLKVSAKLRQKDASVLLENPSQAVAFMVRVRLARTPAGEDLSPVLWDDNYVTLMPGEKKRIAGAYGPDLLRGRRPVLEVDGWNVRPASMALTASK